MFFVYDETQTKLAKATTFPGAEYINLSSVIVDNYGPNYTSIKLSYILQDPLQELKVFNNLIAKKMMNFRIFEISSQQMQDQLSNIKNIKELNDLLQINKVYYKDINAALSFVGNPYKIDEHYIQNNNLFLNYNFDFLLPKKDPEYLSIGCVFYYDVNQYSLENNVLQENISYNVIFGEIKISNLINAKKPVSPSLKDLRIVKDVFAIDRLYEQTSLKTTGVKIQSVDSKKIPNKQFFSNIYYTKKSNTELSALFNLDFFKLVYDNSPLKEVIYKSDSVEKLLNQSSISHFKFKRRLVKKQFKNYVPIEQESSDVIQTYEDSSTGLLTDINDNFGSVKESAIYSNEDLKIRTFQLLDKKVYSTKKGIYQYGIELKIVDGLIEYLYNLTDQLLLDNSLLAKYLSETDKFVTIPKDSRNINPHLLLSSVIKTGYYDPISARFTPAFLYNVFPQQYQGDILKIIARYVESLRILGLLKTSVEDTTSVFTSLLNPSFATAQTISYFIKAHSKLISEINKLLKETKNNYYKLEHWFENDYVDASYDSSLGYEFIEYDSNTVMQTVTDDYINVRADEEIKKYSNNGSISAEQQKKKYAFLSPIKVTARTKTLKLDKLLEEKNTFALQEYKDTELDIKRYNLLKDADKEVMVSDVTKGLSAEQQKQILKSNRLFNDKSVSFEIVQDKNALVSGSEYKVVDYVDPTMLQLGLSKYINYSNNSFIKKATSLSQSYSLQTDLLNQNNSRYFDSTNDYLNDLDINSKYLFLYSSVHQIEYLTYKQNLKDEVWNLFDEDAYRNLSNTKTLFCRLKLVDNPLFDQIKLPVFNSYFLLNYIEGEKTSSRMPLDKIPEEPPRAQFLPSLPPYVPPKKPFGLSKKDINPSVMNIFKAPEDDIYDLGTRTGTGVNAEQDAAYEAYLNSLASGPELPQEISLPTDGATPNVPGDTYDSDSAMSILAPDTRYSMYENQEIRFGDNNDTILLRSQNKKYRLVGRKYGLFLEEIIIDPNDSAEYIKILWEISDAEGAPDTLKDRVNNNVWEIYENGTGISKLAIFAGTLYVSSNKKLIARLYDSSSINGDYTNKLVLQDDGNLVFYTSDYQKLWATNTDGGKKSYAPQNYKGKAPKASGDNIKVY